MGVELIVFHTDAMPEELAFSMPGAEPGWYWCWGALPREVNGPFESSADAQHAALVDLDAMTDRNGVTWAQHAARRFRKVGSIVGMVGRLITDAVRAGRDAELVGLYLVRHMLVVGDRHVYRIVTSRGSSRRRDGSRAIADNCAWAYLTSALYRVRRSGRSRIYRGSFR